MAYRLCGTGDIDAVVKELETRICGRSFTGQLVDKVVRQAGDIKLALLVFEKYFMRSGDRVCLTIMLSAEGSDITADCASAGGGQLIGDLWGATDKFADSGRTALESLGFTSGRSRL